MKKKLLTSAAVAVLGGLAVCGLASCGGGAFEFPTPANWKEPVAPEYKGSCTDDGKVVNIRVWNNEFIGLFKEYYPGVVEKKANEEIEINDSVFFYETDTVKKQVNITPYDSYNTCYHYSLGFLILVLLCLVQFVGLQKKII